MSAGPARTCWAFRSRRAPKPPTTRSTTTSTFRLDENGEQVPIDLPIADATVKEKRGEVYVNVGKTLSPTLRVDGGVNFEFSQPQGQRGRDRRPHAQVPQAEPDARLEAGQRLARAAFGAAHRRAARFLRFHQLRRSVGPTGQRRQRGSAAAAHVGVPVTVDHPLLGDGLFKLDLGHDLVSLLQDRILICDPIIRANGVSMPRATSAPASRYFVQLTLDAPLDHSVERTARQVHRHLQRTRVDDPIDGTASQVQRLLSRLAVGPRRAARSRASCPTAFASTTTSASLSTAPTSSTRTSTAAPT